MSTPPNHAALFLNLILWIKSWYTLWPFLDPNNCRAEVAQLAEHSPEKAGVDSSILSLGTNFGP